MPKPMSAEERDNEWLKYLGQETHDPSMLMIDIKSDGSTKIYSVVQIMNAVFSVKERAARAEMKKRCKSIVNEYVGCRQIADRIEALPDEEE